MVHITHEQNIICSKTCLDGTTHEQTIFVGSYLQVTWWAVGQWKGRKTASNDKGNYWWELFHEMVFEELSHWYRKANIRFVSYVNSVFYNWHEQDIRFQLFTTAHNGSHPQLKKIKDTLYSCYVNPCEPLCTTMYRIVSALKWPLIRRERKPVCGKLFCTALSLQILN